jgi:Cytochrome c7 and related cytochrome c
MADVSDILRRPVLAGACVLAAMAAAVALAPSACSAPEGIHDDPNVRSQPCSNCHQGAFLSARNPVHVGVLPQTCGTCHSTTAWAPATVVNHSWFPLRNKHADVACASCHTVGYKKGDTPTTCFGCHQKDYDAANNPPHAGFASTACETCHTDVGWAPSTFVHPWPLDGMHATTACVGCHTGTPPRWAGTPTPCGACHAADYQRASGAITGHNSFPQTCQDCHTTSGWSPPMGGYAHPEALFPITTGSHSTAGTACIDCHDPTRGTPVKGANTVCNKCHLGTHQQPAIDTHAAHVALGSAYPGPNAASPNFCLGCHPKG